MSLRGTRALGIITALILGACGASADDATNTDSATPTSDSGAASDSGGATDGGVSTDDTEETGGPDEDTGAPEEDATSTPFVDRAAPYFEPDRVLEVAIELAPEDWEALRLETRGIADILGGDCLDGPPEQLFSWFPATVTVDGVTLEEAGVRKKGYLGSMSYDKPSLKVRFDKYVDQLLTDTLGGVLQRLTLNNVQQDYSKLNTCMSYHVFAAAGQPAPRCSFVSATVNGEDMGLYVHVESI